MTATERLRAMLDERKVEWWQSANTLGCIFTRWYSPIFGDEVVAMENGEEGLVLFDHFLTPEQAIAATLGAGTCHSTTPSDAWCFACSECGKSFPRHELSIAHNHGEINTAPTAAGRWWTHEHD